MGSTYTLLAVGDEGDLVIDWFRSLPQPPSESPRDNGVLLYFRQFGPLSEDPKQSPLVNVFLPIRKRGVLTTAGEVHFLPRPMKQYPGLAKLNIAFGKWLSQFTRVYSRNPDDSGVYNYFLEGNLKSHAVEIFAFPQALRALQDGGYFVAEGDNDFVLDMVCKQLRLRDVKGIEDAQQRDAREEKPPVIL
jgi:hypothetical protein